MEMIEMVLTITYNEKSHLLLPLFSPVVKSVSDKVSEDSPISVK